MNIVIVLMSAVTMSTPTSRICTSSVFTERGTGTLRLPFEKKNQISDVLFEPVAEYTCPGGVSSLALITGLGGIPTKTAVPTIRSALPHVPNY